MSRFPRLLRKLGRSATATRQRAAILFAAASVLLTAAIQPMQGTNTPSRVLSESRARFGSSGDATRALTAAIGAASEETLGAAIERSHEAQLLADLASAFAERGKRRNQPCD